MLFFMKNAKKPKSRAFWAKNTPKIGPKMAKNDPQKGPKRAKTPYYFIFSAFFHFFSLFWQKTQKNRNLGRFGQNRDFWQKLPKMAKNTILGHFPVKTDPRYGFSPYVKK